MSKDRTMLGRCAALVALLSLCTRAHAGDTTRLMLDVRTPMRDGIELSSDIWLPGEGKHPLILIRTPYLKTSPTLGPKLAKFFARAGYAVAIQDVRGRGDSQGRFRYHQQEAPDGYDTVEWMAAQ